MDKKATTLRTLTNKRTIMKAMIIMLTIAIFATGTMTVAFADAKDGIKEVYSLVLDIAQIAGALLALFGLIQLGVSIGQTHDASQRMTGILLIAGGAIIFFAKDILNLMGIQV